jgi:hypothetical protein
MSDWTPELKDKAKALWAQGVSASQIARALPIQVSRNAVIGILHRAGVARRFVASKPKRVPKPPCPAPAATETLVPIRNFAIGGKGAVILTGEPRPTKSPAKASAFDALPGSTPRPFTERPAFGCKWPIGDEAWSCCLRSETGRYCPTHEAMSRGAQPKARTGNELARSLRRYA